MSDIPPNPPVPPTPGEAAKVQPKKETVRIALPPKPTAAPTVRLPSPAPATSAPTAATAAPVAATAAKPAPAAPSAAKSAAPAAAPAAPAPLTRSAPVSMGGGISGLDKGLAVAAAVLGLAFLVHVVLIAFGIQVE